MLLFHMKANSEFTVDVCVIAYKIIIMNGNVLLPGSSNVSHMNVYQLLDEVYTESEASLLIHLLWGMADQKIKSIFLNAQNNESLHFTVLTL